MAAKYARQVKAILTQRCFCPPPEATIQLCEIVYEAAMDAKKKKLKNNSARQEIADYTMKIMSKIDDAKKRGAYNDLSVIAYALVNKLISATK